MAYKNKEDQKTAARRSYEKHKAVVMARSAEKRRVMKEYVDELKASTPCTDCNNKYPSYVMDFDHLPEFDKVDEVAHLVQRGSWQKLLDEIAKCDIVCSNCHRIRTFTRLASIMDRIPDYESGDEGSNPS